MGLVMQGNSLVQKAIKAKSWVDRIKLLFSVTWIVVMCLTVGIMATGWFYLERIEDALVNSASFIGLGIDTFTQWWEYRKFVEGA